MVTIRGKVVEQAKEDATDRLAKKYLGVDKYPLRSPNEKRIILKIKPERVHYQPGHSSNGHSSKDKASTYLPGCMEMQILKITPPPDVQIILGQSHFIKTVEDVSECLVSCVPNINFGIGFCDQPIHRWQLN
jgi:hypothetical protein